MRSNWASAMSAFGIPVLGLSGLLLSLWHTSAAQVPAYAGQDLIMLQEPDSRFDKTLAICLNQQAKEVAVCRAKMSAAATAHAVAEYNLVAHECTPAVFVTTHLPPSLEL